MVEYICLSCGTQGLVLQESGCGDKDLNVLRCPICGSRVQSVERKRKEIPEEAFAHLTPDRN